MSLPPTLFSAELADAVRSRVKFTLVGALFVAFEQLSRNAAGITDNPHKAMPFFRNSFLSIVYKIVALFKNNV
jgi:hypothetical protein